MRASVVLALASLLCAAHRSARAAYIDSNLAVSPETQQNGGGCYPQSLRGPITEMLNLINPEWAAIDVDSHLPPESEPVTLHGTVALAKINEGGNFAADQVSDDQNTLIEVDPADMALVATGTARRRAPSSGSSRSSSIPSSPGRAWAIG